MSDQKIDVRVTETEQVMAVTVFSKRPDKIEVVLGEGVHSVKCELTLTANANAYAGSAMGRVVFMSEVVKMWRRILPWKIMTTGIQGGARWLNSLYHYNIATQ
jgi:hypothetical protein